MREQPLAKQEHERLQRQHKSDGVTPQLVAHDKIVAGLGANCPGPWGTAAETVRRALSEIAARGVTVTAVSPFYATAAVGRARQPPYVNAVALIDTSLPPEALLRLFKRIERDSGRRGGRPWGQRTLDIDLIDYKGRVKHWRGQRADFARAGQRPLVLPHPLMHQRPFVLRPLLDIAPNWRHPALNRSAGELWHRISESQEGRVLKRL